MKTKALLFLITTLAAGCSNPKIWYQPGVSAEDTQRDFGGCRMQAASAPVATGRQMNGIGVYLSAQIAQGSFLNACMMSKGYQPALAKTITNASSFPRY